MDDTFGVVGYLDRRFPAESAVGSAVVVGAGYIGMEMAEALTARGLRVTVVERLPQVLPTVDSELGHLVAEELRRHGVDVVINTAITQITRADERLKVNGSDGFERHVDLVLVVVGVRPDVTLAERAGAELGAAGAIAVDDHMRTSLPDVFAAGDCVHTHHRLRGTTYLPLGTTAHKQGSVAGENAAGGDRRFAGSVGTQVVKVFDLAAARTGLRDQEAADAGFAPVTVASQADDHKAYYPGAHRIHLRFTGDQITGRLLGAQLVGHRQASIARRIDIAATALFHNMTFDQLSDLDLSYTPPLGSPWDAVQVGRRRGNAPYGQHPARHRRGQKPSRPTPSTVTREETEQPRSRSSGSVAHLALVTDLVGSLRGNTYTRDQQHIPNRSSGLRWRDMLAA